MGSVCLFLHQTPQCRVFTHLIDSYLVFNNRTLRNQMQVWNSIDGVEIALVSLKFTGIFSHCYPVAFCVSNSQMLTALQTFQLVQAFVPRPRMRPLISCIFPIGSRSNRIPHDCSDKISAFLCRKSNLLVIVWALQHWTEGCIYDTVVGLV